MCWDKSLPLNLHSLRRHLGCFFVPSRVDIWFNIRLIGIKLMFYLWTALFQIAVSLSSKLSWSRFYWCSLSLSFVQSSYAFLRNYCNIDGLDLISAIHLLFFVGIQLGFNEWNHNSRCAVLNILLLQDVAKWNRKHVS